MIENYRVPPIMLAFSFEIRYSRKQKHRMSFFINQILSQRSYMSHRHYFSITFEWEDELSRQLGLPIVGEKRNVRHKIYKWIPGLPALFQTGVASFAYEMSPNINNRYNNKKNILPNIIDFYLHDSQLDTFCKEYRKNPAVLISSKEVYEHLQNRGVGEKLKLFHCALSLSDKYKISADTTFEKKEDLILLGRTNPVLQEFLDIYTKKHPDFTYAQSRRQGDEFHVYNNRGEHLGPATSREDYMKMMKLSRCALYSPPGIDGDENRTAGFSQITPRLLEIAACGCNIIARYKMHADARFYEIDKLAANIDSYDEFETAMDKARETPADMQMYADWLSKHYTSARAATIKSILEQI